MIPSFNLVGWAFENLLTVVPLRVVESGQLGVRKVRGIAKRTLKPGGPYLHIRGLFEVEKVDSAEQGLNLPTQTLTTKDGQERTLSMNVTYEIEEAHLTSALVQNLDNTLSFRAMTAMSRKVRKTTTEDLHNKQTEIEASIRRSLQVWADDVGVLILEVGVTDHVKTRSLRLFGDTTTNAEDE